MAALWSACTVARRSRAARGGQACSLWPYLFSRTRRGNGGELFPLKKIAVTLAALLLLQPSGLVFAQDESRNHGDVS
jgi:hypothetical protein